VKEAALQQKNLREGANIAAVGKKRSDERAKDRKNMRHPLQKVKKRAGRRNRGREEKRKITSSASRGREKEKTKQSCETEHKGAFLWIRPEGDGHRHNPARIECILRRQTTKNVEKEKGREAREEIKGA